jgi:hypothetical protein
VVNTGTSSPGKYIAVDQSVIQKSFFVKAFVVFAFVLGEMFVLEVGTHRNGIRPRQHASSMNKLKFTNLIAKVTTIKGHVMKQGDVHMFSQETWFLCFSFIHE